MCTSLQTEVSDYSKKQQQRGFSFRGIRSTKQRSGSKESWEVVLRRSSAEGAFSKLYKLFLFSLLHVKCLNQVRLFTLMVGFYSPPHPLQLREEEEEEEEGGRLVLSL